MPSQFLPVLMTIIDIVLALIPISILYSMLKKYNVVKNVDHYISVVIHIRLMFWLHIVLILFSFVISVFISPYIYHHFLI